MLHKTVSMLVVCVSAVCSLPLCDYCQIVPKPSKDAAILTENRYQSTGGQFGSSYTQEDGIEFKEESDSEGNRKGSYTYIDSDGKRRTVSYTAGKDGFRAIGDHLPVPAPTFNTAPQIPTFNNFQLQSSRNLPENLQVQYQSLKPSFHHQQYWNHQQPQFQSQQPQQFQQQPHHQPEPQSFIQQSPPPPPQQQQQQLVKSEQHQPQQPQYSLNQNLYASTTTTEFPIIAKQYPPAKLNVNQSPDGYSYTFNTIL